MSLWKVLEVVDVWGNPIDGYENVETREQGYLSIRDDWDDLKTVEALVKTGYLQDAAVEELNAGGLAIESDHGDGYEISEADQAWGLVEDNDERTYLISSDEYIRRGFTAAQVAEAEGEGYEAEAYALTTGNRPVLILQPEYPDDAARPFWRAKVQHTYKALVAEPDRGWIEAVVELRANPEKLARKNRKGVGVYQVQVYVDGEYFGSRDFPGDFEGEEAIGLAENGAVISADPELVLEQRVALDGFIDRGGEPDIAFLTVSVLEDDRFLFQNDPDLPKLVERDGVNDAQESWDIEYTQADLVEIRRGPAEAREWATRLVAREDPESLAFMEQLKEDHPEFSKRQIDAMKARYQNGVVSGLTMKAGQYVEQGE